MRKETISMCYLLESLGQTTELLFILSTWFLLCDLIGTSPQELALAGGLSDQNLAVRFAEKEGNYMVVSSIDIGRTVFCALVGQYHESVDAAVQARKIFDSNKVELEFYEGLSLLALARESSGCLRRTLVSTARRRTKLIRGWTTHCPANFRNKYALLQAELEALRGRTKNALSLFNDSIAAAQTEGFVHEEGLAFERLAQYLCVLGHFRMAAPYFVCARDAYARWGAHVLVDRINVLMATKCNSGGLR